MFWEKKRKINKEKKNQLTKLDSSGDAKLSSRTLTLTVNVSAMIQKKRNSFFVLDLFTHFQFYAIVSNEFVPHLNLTSMNTQIFNNR